MSYMAMTMGSGVTTMTTSNMLLAVLVVLFVLIGRY
jgi:hypothetical protein